MAQFSLSYMYLISKKTFSSNISEYADDTSFYEHTKIKDLQLCVSKVQSTIIELSTKWKSPVNCIETHALLRFHHIEEYAEKVQNNAASFVTCTYYKQKDVMEKLNCLTIRG